MPLVTVITAARNAETLVAAAVDSIREQTFTDWRMVVVDDASTDATGDAARAAADGDARIEVVRLDANVGPYAAANAVLPTVDSPYIARLDADDIALANRLADQLATLEAQSDRDACTGAWRLLDAAGVIGHVRQAPTDRNGFLKWRLFFRNGMPHSTMFIRTDAMRRYGGYGSERVAEDFRLWCRLARDGRVTLTREPVLLWRQSPGQITAAPGARDQEGRLRVRLDHLAACDPPGEWTLEDARDLRHVGGPAPFPVRRAMTLVDRWVAAWQADPSLDVADRAELRRFERFLRSRHLRHSVRTDPVGAARAAPRLLRLPR